MRSLILVAASLLALAAGNARAELYYLIVGGIGGNPAYDEEFAESIAAMAAAAERTLGGTDRLTVLSGDGATRDALRAALAELARSMTESDRIAVFLVGHGSDDGVEYKFNLKGEDIDGTELGELLAALPARTQLVMNATSASGALLESWAADGRSLITATRSGRERNATRFAEHWAAALSSDEADINKNGSISVQEAFDFASLGVADSFASDGALATEHPEIRGDATAAFEIARLTERVAVTPELEALYAQLAELEDDMAALTRRRAELGDDYLPQFQALAVELALVQERIDEAAAGP